MMKQIKDTKSIFPCKKKYHTGAGTGEIASNQIPA